MSTESTNQYFRLLAQNSETTADLQVTAPSIERAIEIGESKFKTDKYRPFVVRPIASEHAYMNGHISFCPRCGVNIAKDMGDDGDENYQNEASFTCDNCDAEIDVNITVEETEESED